MPACATPFHPPCLFAAGPGATAGRGSAVGYQWGYFHNGCLKPGGAGEGRGEGEGAEEQPQRLALQTRTCSARSQQPGAGARARVRLPRDPSPHPLAHLLPATCLQIRSKGAPPTFPCLVLPPSCFCLGGSGSGWIRVGPGTTIPRKAPEADGNGKGKGRWNVCPQPGQTPRR